jgi:hypothetical protein
MHERLVTGPCSCMAGNPINIPIASEPPRRALPHTILALPHQRRESRIDLPCVDRFIQFADVVVGTLCHLYNTVSLHNREASPCPTSPPSGHQHERLLAHQS